MGQVKNGHIRRLVDDEVRSLVLEISGTNVATTYITCPIKPRLSLGIKLPFLVMIIKNMKKYFTFEIQILDDKDMHRRFRVSNFQSTTKVRPFCTTMPIGLSSGWNQVQFNLADFTKRAYGSTYLETTRVQIHANVRIRRIYFSDVLYSDEDLPNEYKLFIPTPGTQTATKPSKTEKKESISKEKKVQKASIEEPQVPIEEPPSGALPSPAGFDSAKREEVVEAEVTEIVVTEEVPIAEPTVAEEAKTEVVEEVAVGEAPVVEEAKVDEVAGTEGGAAGDETLGEEVQVATAEEAPGEEASPGETPGEIVTDAPVEEPHVEEGTIEEVPVEAEVVEEAPVPEEAA